MMLHKVLDHKGADGREWVLFFPQYIDTDGTYLEPSVFVVNSRKEVIGRAKFENQRVYSPRKYKGRLVFEVSLEHRSLYGKQWKDSATTTSLTKDLNAWWSTFSLPGTLKIVGHTTGRGHRFLEVEVIR